VADTPVVLIVLETGGTARLDGVFLRPDGADRGRLDGEIDALATLLPDLSRYLLVGVALHGRNVGPRPVLKAGEVVPHIIIDAKLAAVCSALEGRREDVAGFAVLEDKDLVVLDRWLSSL